MSFRYKTIVLGEEELGRLQALAVEVYNDREMKGTPARWLATFTLNMLGGCDWQTLPPSDKERAEGPQP